MGDIFSSSMGIMGVIVAAIFVAAGMKLWQQSREEEKGKKP